MSEKKGFFKRLAQGLSKTRDSIASSFDSIFSGFSGIDEDFYEVLGDAYHEAIVAAGQDEELYKLWKDRLESVLHDFAGFGWGMEEYICEEYYSLPWIQEDNE